MPGSSSRRQTDPEAPAAGQRPDLRAPVPAAVAAAAPFLAAGNAAATAVLRFAPPRPRALSRKEGDPPAPSHTLERSEETGEVDTPSGTVYATPDLKGEEVAKLHQGTQVKVRGVRDGEWYAVDVDGKSGWMSIMELAVTRGENAPARSAVNLDDWAAVVPDAKLRADVDPKTVKSSKGHQHATGRLGAFDEVGDTGVGKFGYRKDAKGELAVAGATGAGVTPSDIDGAVDKVKSARAAVKQRYMVGAGSGNAYAGLQTTPEYEQRGPAADKKKWEAEQKQRKKAGLDPTQQPESEWQAGADASVAYKAWLNLPTTVPKAIADPEDMNWKAFRRIFDWEGFPSAVQTYDQANITFGVGFAGLQAEELLQRILQKSPDAKAALHAAGVSQDGTDLIVVDVDRKWKLRGLDAQVYLRDSRELISLFVNIFQGTFQSPKEPAKVDTDMRQKVLDANWEQFAARTMSGMTAPPKGSDVDLWALKLHTRHAGSYVGIAQLNAWRDGRAHLRLHQQDDRGHHRRTRVLAPSRPRARGLQDGPRTRRVAHARPRIKEQLKTDETVALKELPGPGRHATEK